MRAKRVDANHAEIRRTLEACGWRILGTHACAGFVDLVAWHPATEKLRLVEVKVRKGRFTKGQQELIDEGWPICVLRSVQDAIDLR